MFPIEKYKFYTNGKKVIAKSTYAGKTIQATATCGPMDEFNLEIGKRIAAARCDLKIADKRMINFNKKRFDIIDKIALLKHELDEIDKYCLSATEEFVEAKKRLNDLTREYGPKYHLVRE